MPLIYLICNSFAAGLFTVLLFYHSLEYKSHDRMFWICFDVFFLGFNTMCIMARYNHLSTLLH